MSDLPSYASSIDSQLEEEEQYADQLKEYNAFGDSVRAVVRRYECTQYDLEKAEDTLAARRSQRETLVSCVYQLLSCVHEFVA